MAQGTSFLPVLADDLPKESIRKILLVSGKLYYDLLKERTARKLSDVAIIRVEELAPFPKEELSEEIAKYSKVDQVVWVQEEPMNQGPWTFVEPRLRAALEAVPVRYWGRKPSPVTAAGVSKVHKLEQDMVVKGVFDL